MKSIRTIFAALLVSFLTTACLNGGGGSGAITPTPTPTPPLPADLQTSVPEPASADLKALNTLRGQLGLGLLIEDSRLVNVSTKNAYYALSYASAEPHSNGGDAYWTIETPGNYYFSGVTATDRCLAEGYFGICSNVITLENGRLPLDVRHWFGNLNEFLAKPYGGIMMFLQFPRDAGVSRISGIGSMSIPYLTSWHFGTPTSGGQRQGPGFVLTYPLPDSTVVQTISFGHAINLHINAGETLSVDSFTLLDKNGSAVAATLLTQATDPEKFIPGHVAVLVPNAPLVSGMSYTVNFWGKRNGTVFSRTWSFSVL